jgi:hypothetical protein
VRASAARDLQRHDQGPGGHLPLCQVLLGLRQLHDVVGGILERDELAAVGKRNRIFERAGPPPRALTQRDQRRLG